MLSKFKKNKKRGEKKHYVLHVIGFLILFISVFLVVKNVSIWHKKQQLSAQVASLEKQVSDIKSNNDNLQQGIKSSDDSQYIEKVAREELDLQKTGEQAVSFIVAKNDTQKVQTAKPNLLQSLWNWITGKNK